MAHAHSHHGIIHDHAHAQYTIFAYRSYRYLFAVSLLGAAAEFLVALLMTHSVSAQTDAMHTLTHLSLYALACLVSRQIIVRRMDAHRAYHYHEKFLKYYAFLVFAGLAWVATLSIIKLILAETVIASPSMLVSVGAGLCANIIALKILSNISNNHDQAVHSHKTHKLFILDAKGDLAISVIVLVTSSLYMIFPLLPIHIIDPLISFAAIVWIGWSGIQIIKGKQI